MANSLTPEGLWDSLILLDSNGFSTMRPDLDMLREVYQKSKQYAEGQAIRKSFESALEIWTDNQMREFSKRLSESGQLVGVETASRDELRDFLGQVYNYIFG